MSGMSILTRDGDADRFEAAAAALRGAADRDEFDQGPFGRRYHPLALGDRYRDRALVVSDSGRPIALFECGCLGGTYGYFGMPIRPRFAEGLGARPLAAALAAFRDHLAKHAAADGAACAVIEGGAGDDLVHPDHVRWRAAGLARLFTDLLCGFDPLGTEEGVRVCHLSSDLRSRRV